MDSLKVQKERLALLENIEARLKDIESLEASGVGKLYGPGTPVNETIDYITNWVKKNRR